VGGEFDADGPGGMRGNGRDGVKIAGPAAANVTDACHPQLNETDRTRKAALLKEEGWKLGAIPLRCAAKILKGSLKKEILRDHVCLRGQ